MTTTGLPSSIVYYAIRKCGSLYGPAIFTNKDDCNKHVRAGWEGGGLGRWSGESTSDTLTINNNNNGVDVMLEYETFASIIEALEYIGVSLGGTSQATTVGTGTAPVVDTTINPASLKRPPPPLDPTTTATGTAEPPAKKRRGRPPKRSISTTTARAEGEEEEAVIVLGTTRPAASATTTTITIGASSEGAIQRRRTRTSNEATPEAAVETITPTINVRRTTRLLASPASLKSPGEGAAVAARSSRARASTSTTAGAGSIAGVTIRISNDDDIESDDDDDDVESDNDDDDNDVHFDPGDGDSDESSVVDDQRRRKRTTRTASSGTRNNNSTNQSSTNEAPQRGWERPDPLTWDQGFQMLTEYKLQHDGSVDVKYRSNDDDDDVNTADDNDDGSKWKGLYSWYQLQKVRLAIYEQYQLEQQEEGQNQQQSNSAETDDLSDDGDKTRLPVSLFDSTWKERLEQLKSLGVTASDDSDSCERGDTSEVSNDGTTPNVPVATTPTASSRHQKWERRFRQFVQYQLHHNAVSVKRKHSLKGGRYEGLMNWVNAQLDRLVTNRRKHSSNFPSPFRPSPGTAREIDLLYEIGLGERLPPLHATPAATPRRSRDSLNGNTHTDGKWQNKFRLLVDYQSVFHTTDVDPVHCQTVGGKFYGLDVWVRAQQASFKRFERKREEMTEDQLTKSYQKRRIDQLMGIQFDFKLTKADDEFEKSMAALQAFKAEHGHCNVRKEPKELYNFVHRMKSQLRNRQKDPSTSYLDDEKVQRLVELGGETFTELNPQTQVTFGRPRDLTVDEYWEEMFQELVAFKEKHGHTNIPHFPRSHLRNWIVCQRTYFEKMKSGEAAKAKKPSPLTPERIARLTQLGFSMNYNYTKVSFEQRALEWLEFRTKNNGKEPPTETTAVGKWALRVRRLRKQALAGKKNLLTDEQVKQLTDWGFKWETGIKMPPKTEPFKTWEERYQELIQYYRTHGNSNVPQKFPGLGNWVHRQRKEYSWRKSGIKNAMSDEKVKKLKSVGFQWVTRKRPGKTLEETAEFNRDGVVVDSDPEEETDGDEEEEEENVGVAHAHPPRVYPPAGVAAMPAADRQYDVAGTSGMGPYFAPWDRFRVQF